LHGAWQVSAEQVPDEHGFWHWPSSSDLTTDTPAAIPTATSTTVDIVFNTNVPPFRAQGSTIIESRHLTDCLLCNDGPSNVCEMN
jgi:hypothetical protein